MSVDPDDNTPGGIKAAGADIVAYGAPVLPGAMFLLGYFDDGTPVMGLPGCVMYADAPLLRAALSKNVPAEPGQIVSFDLRLETCLCYPSAPARAGVL